MSRHRRRSKNLVLKAAVVALAAGAAHPAAAGWAFTEWGMSEDEVLAAGKGRVARFVELHREPWGLYPELIGDYRDLQHSFEVEFYFDRKGSGLVGVRLAPYGLYWCMDLLQALLQKYGYANMVRHGGMLEFSDPRTNNLISHRFEPCSLRYQPLDPAKTAPR